MRLFGFSFILLISIWLGSVDSIHAQDDIGKKVQSLVSELNTDDRDEIDKAIRKLVALGEDCLDPLEEAFGKAKPVVQARILLARSKIEQSIAEQKVKASKVTLEGDMTFDEAIAQIQKQTKTRFAYEPIDRERLELSLKDVTLWEAMDEILDQSLMQISPYGGEGGSIGLVPRSEEVDDFVGRTAYSGAFRVIVSRIDSSKDYNNPRNEGTTIKLDINWESHVKPIAIEQSLTELKVRDEFKDNLAVKLPEGSASPVIGDSVQPDIPNSEMYIPLELVDRKIGKIDTLEGTIRVLLPGRIETFDFGTVGKIKKNQTIQRSHAKVSFIGSEKNDDLYTLMLSVEFDEKKNPLEVHQGWILENEIFLKKADGTKIQALGVEQAMMKQNQMVVTYLFEGDPKEHQLIYKTPAQLIKIPVKYKLRNIILP